MFRAALKLVLACLLALLLTANLAQAGDLWNWDEPWENREGAAVEYDPIFPVIPEGVFELPRKILSLQTHGAYFGSGDEYLMGGAQVFGIGGARHVGDHSLNLPAAALAPEIARLLGASDMSYGPIWGGGVGADAEATSQPSGEVNEEPDEDSRKGSKSKIRWLRYDN